MTQSIERNGFESSYFEPIEPNYFERPDFERPGLERSNLERGDLERGDLERGNFEPYGLEHNRLERNQSERNRLERNRLERNRLERNRLERNQLEHPELEPQSLAAKHLAHSDKTTMKLVWAGGCIVAACGVMISDPQALLPQVHAAKDSCHTVVQAKAELSRAELTEFLAIPEKSSRAKVRQAIAEPYCTLKSAQIRAKTPADREAYPLAFDHNTWLVVMYEDNEYVGYDFSIR